MHIHEANLANLQSLWKEYGSQCIKSNTLPTLYANTHWPNRCWFDWGNLSVDEIQQTLQTKALDNTLLINVPETAILPLWQMKPIADNRNTNIDSTGINSTKNNNTISNGHTTLLNLQLMEKQLIENNWICEFEQTAMYLALRSETSNSSTTHPEFQVNSIHSSADITKWVDIASDAFAYHIDQFVLERLLNNKDIQMFLGCQNDTAVASALLYKTGDIIGIHQVGVKPLYQGMGIAKRFMQELITIYAQSRGSYCVLQASRIGRPLYDSLGFKEQFLIKNYTKPYSLSGMCPYYEGSFRCIKYC